MHLSYLYLVSCQNIHCTEQNLGIMASALVYTRAASYYHWMVAAPLVGSIACVLKAQYTPKEEKKEKMMWMWRHKSLGVLTGLVVLPRVGYRLFNAAKYRIRDLPGEGPIIGAAGKAGHLGLYAFMTIMPVSGIAMGMFGGKGLPFFWTTIPGFEKKNGKLAGQVRFCCFKSFIILNVSFFILFQRALDWIGLNE